MDTMPDDGFKPRAIADQLIDSQRCHAAHHPFGFRRRG
jgi:hypothetical protein